jgi:hypothetical protein
MLKLLLLAFLLSMCAGDMFLYRLGDMIRDCPLIEESTAHSNTRSRVEDEALLLSRLPAALLFVRLSIAFICSLSFLNS